MVICGSVEPDPSPAPRDDGGGGGGCGCGTRAALPAHGARIPAPPGVLLVGAAPLPAAHGAA
ncbi:hypothetical protein D7B24_003563, partial [Verticillium nonalfalfae]